MPNILSTLLGRGKASDRAGANGRSQRPKRLMQFVAIDVETANSQPRSICQIGMVRCADGVLTDEWTSLINPEARFSRKNTAIHGLTAKMVAQAPKLPDVRHVLEAWLRGNVVVCHTGFDRAALKEAFEKYGLQQFGVTWLDSSRVARHTWPDCRYKGYALTVLADRLGYEYHAHDALEDAKAAAHVIVSAARVSRMDIDRLLKRSQQPLPYDDRPAR
jgi:DNA polymerase III subunit epsilon